MTSIARLSEKRVDSAHEVTSNADFDHALEQLPLVHSTEGPLDV